jgi:hypothetical protein
MHGAGGMAQPKSVVAATGAIFSSKHAVPSGNVFWNCTFFSPKLVPLGIFFFEAYIFFIECWYCAVQ